MEPEERRGEERRGEAAERSTGSTEEETKQEIEAPELNIIGRSKRLLTDSCVIGKARGDAVRRLG